MNDPSKPVDHARHRGTAREHAPAVVAELEHIDLPSGRTVFFRHETFNGAHALLIVTRDPRTGRESYVRLPLGTMPQLRAAIDALVDRARKAATETPVVGTRGRPRGRVAP